MLTTPATLPPAPAAAKARLDRRDALAGFALGALLLGVYHLSFWRGLPGSGDSAKFQLVGELLGTPHATGYPTWVLLCHALDRLWPWGSPAYRADLVTALFAVAGTLLVAATLRGLGVGRAASAAAAACLGLTPTLWSQAVMAEVYTLHALFAAAVIYALLRYHAERRAVWLEAALALYVLSFTDHMTTVCLAPGIAVFVLRVEPAALRRWRTWGVLAAAGAVGLGIYGYIVACTYWHRVPYLEMQAADFRQLLDNLAGGPHRGNLFQLGWRDLLTARLPRIGGLVGREFGPLLGLAVWGAWGRRTAVDALLGLIFLGSLGFLAIYTVPDLFVYALPAYLVVGLYLGLGLARLTARWPALARFPGALVLALPALLLLVQGPLLEADAARRARAGEIDATLARVAPAAVLYSLDYETSMGLLYRTHFGTPGYGGIVVQHLPPASLGLPVSLQPLRRYLETGATFRVGPQGQLLPAGLPVYAFVLQAEHLAALARRGIAATPVADHVFRLSSGPGPGSNSSAPPPLPRAFVVHTVESVATVPGALAVFHRADFDPRRLALKLDPLPGGTQTAGAATGPETVEVSTYSEHRVDVAVVLTAPGWLVLADSYSALWTAEVDGKPVPSVGLDVFFRGVPLAAGRHGVRWRDDRRFTWRGFWLSP